VTLNGRQAVDPRVIGETFVVIEMMHPATVRRVVSMQKSQVAVQQQERADLSF